MTYVLLEGVDGAGKTTLANHLADRYRVQIQHVGPPNHAREALAELLKLCLDLEDQGCTDVVFDRFHFGNLAYGEVFRGANDLTALEWEVLERMLHGAGCLLILCQPPVDHVRSTFQHRHMTGSTDPRGFEDHWPHLETVMDLMHHAYNISTLDKMVYDYTAPEALAEVEMRVEGVVGWQRWVEAEQTV